jgi:hypothetical protein
MGGLKYCLICLKKYYTVFISIQMKGVSIIMILGSNKHYCKTLYIADDYISNYFKDITIGKNRVYELNLSEISRVLKVDLDKRYNNILFMKYVCSDGYKRYLKGQEYEKDFIDFMKYLYTVIDRERLDVTKHYKWNHDFSVNKMKSDQGDEYYLIKSYVKSKNGKLHRHIYKRNINIINGVIHHKKHTFDNRFDSLEDLDRSSHYSKHHPEMINEHTSYLCKVTSKKEFIELLADL